jgi:hypothetical protein
MPGLTDLSTYKTISDSQLVGNYNLLIDAVNANFAFTLMQVSDPLPSTSSGRVGDVLAIGAGSILKYDSISNLINIQDVYNTYLTSAQQLRLNKSLTKTLLSTSLGLNAYTVAAQLPGGAVADSVSFAQLNIAGDLRESHTVNQFLVDADSASLTVNAGYFQVNALAVAGYAFPSNTPTDGQVLMAELGDLIFADLPNYLQLSLGAYSLVGSYPLKFSGVTYPQMNVMFGDQAGIGFIEGSSNSEPKHLYFRIGSVEVFRITKPQDGFVPFSPYLTLSRGLVLASTDNIDRYSNPNGSLWYDYTSDSIVIVTNTGRKYISGSAAAEAVNTAETKDFVLQSTSTFSVAGGTEEKPALNIGTAGLTAAEGNLKIVVGGSAVAQISNKGLESSSNIATATAKVLLADTVGINNPQQPAYSFANSSGLGLYRSDINSVAVAVQGSAVMEFRAAEVSLKGNSLTNIAEPVALSDAATKNYVDNIVPVGITPGCLPIVSSGTTTKYIQSDAKYVNGTLEIGNTAAPAAFKMNSSGGGAVVIKAPSTNNSVVFELPANTSNNGILKTQNGRTSWVDPATLTEGALKADGSVALNASLNVGIDTTPTTPIIGRVNTGIYAGVETEVKVGFSAQGSRLLEANASKDALLGATDLLNAPFIRLSNTLSNYSIASTSGSPTYAFAGENNTGVGQTQVQSVSLMVSGAAKLTAGTTSINAHSNKIEGVADPVNNSDVATKNYVDKVVKPRKEISFLVGSLPVGWSSGAALILSIYDKALVYNSATAALTYESASSPTTILIPSNFSTNADCQVYVDNVRLVKMAKNSGIREVAFASSRAIVLNYNLAIGQIVTIHLPG